MQALRKLPFVILALLATAWAQSNPASTQGSDSQTQTAPPAPVPPDSEKKTQDQPPPAAPADSTVLEPIKTVKATYPDEAREKRLQGQVVVKVQVSETGDVESAEVTSGDPIFAKAAVEAAKKWKFKPFIRNGKPETVYTLIPFNFAFADNVADTKSPQRVRVSSGVSQGLLIHKVNPVYPPAARSARVQGTVVLQAVIGKDGQIADLHVITGDPMLAPAAIGAVQQWRYKPYLLEGQPVEVDTQIQVNFQLRY
jgi:TonB family protein